MIASVFHLHLSVKSPGSQYQGVRFTSARPACAPALQPLLAFSDLPLVKGETERGWTQYVSARA
jgi:hypothetical protein